MFPIRMWKVFWYVLVGYGHLMHSRIKQKKRKNIQIKIFKQHVIYRIRRFWLNKERRKTKEKSKRETCQRVFKHNIILHLLILPYFIYFVRYLFSLLVFKFLFCIFSHSLLVFLLGFYLCHQLTFSHFLLFLSTSLSLSYLGMFSFFSFELVLILLSFHFYFKKDFLFPIIFALHSVETYFHLTKGWWNLLSEAYIVIFKFFIVVSGN